MCRAGNLISVIHAFPDNYGAVIAVIFRNMNLLSSLGHSNVLRDSNILSTPSFLKPIRSWKNPDDRESKCHITLVGSFSSSPILGFHATQCRKNLVLMCKGGIPGLSALRPVVGLRGLWWTSVAERGFHEQSLSGYGDSAKDDLGNHSTNVSSSVRDEISLEGDGEDLEEESVDLANEEDELRDGEMQSGEDDYRLWGVKSRTKGTLKLIQSTPCSTNRAPNLMSDLSSSNVAAAGGIEIWSVFSGHSNRQSRGYNNKMSYHKFNENARRRELIGRLQRGEILALISDAGMPGISDPGSELVKACVEENVKVFPIPGPSAALTALVASGLPTEEFSFVGFLPAQASSRRKRLSAAAKESATHIFFVPPHKLCRVLDDFISTFGASRRCAIAREMTKMHEEFWRSTLEEAKVEFEKRQPRGELTLIVEGHPEGAGVQRATNEELTSRLEILMDAGKSLSEAMKLVVEETSARRNVVYSLALEISKRSK